MPPKTKWVWEVYFLIILFFAVQRVYFLVTPGSPGHLYYYILRSFHPLFYFVYSAHVINIFLHIIQCLPLYLYVHRIRFLKPRVWQYLFVLKCVFEVIGHSYKLNVLKALYHSDPKFLLIVLVMMVLPFIPFYLACYWYAFGRD